MLLKESKTDINTITGSYGTALNVAAAAAEGSADHHRMPIMKLLDAGANPFLGNRNSPNVVAVAVARSDSETMKFLIDYIANIFTRCCEVSYFPVVHAVDRGDLEMVKCLLQNGADVNESTPLQNTALQVAAAQSACDLKIIDYLLTQGADVNAKGGGFGNVLQAAIAQDNKAAVQLLQEHNALLDPPGAYWDALLASIEESLLYGELDEEEAKQSTRRLDHFQRTHGMKSKSWTSSD